jgi:hypothetical protein
MSTIHPATDWFGRKRTTTSADPKAVRRRLIRMLAGDSERPRPPVTLPRRYLGHHAGADPVGHEHCADAGAQKVDHRDGDRERGAQEQHHDGLDHHAGAGARAAAHDHLGADLHPLAGAGAHRRLATSAPAPKWTGSIPRGHASRSGIPGGVEPTPADAAGPYSLEELERMDRAFVTAVEHAFQNGGEHRSAARASMQWRHR